MCSKNRDDMECIENIRQFAEDVSNHIHAFAVDKFAHIIDYSVKWR